MGVQRKNLRAAISLRSRATVVSIHYTGRIAQVFFSKKSNFFERCTFAVLLRQLLSGAHEARERTRRFRAAALSSAAVPGATESRKRYAVAGRQPFHGTLFIVHTSCVSNTPLPGWGFRRLRAAGERHFRAGPKRVDNLRFCP